MFCGYLTKRNSPISPPSMQKYYSVLWGTLLLDFENEDEAKNSMCPKFVTEVLGVSEWDGKGRSTQYPFAFLLVTHTGSTHYASANSLQERDEWIAHTKRALECVFANAAIAPFKPSKIIQNRPPSQNNLICPRTGNKLIIPIGCPYQCRSCGRGFYSPELISEMSAILQLGVEECEKVCLDCKNAQMCLLWLKSLNYVHAMDLHEMTHSVLQDVVRYRFSFLLRQRTSPRLAMAAQLLDRGDINPSEFEELRRVDHAYLRELVHDDSQKLKAAAEAFGEDMQTILGLLTNPSMTEKGSRRSYHVVIVRILEIADKYPDLIDFYLPQLIQVHLQEARNRTPDSLMKVDLLQQALLAMSKKYPALGMKLAWNLQGSIADYEETQSGPGAAAAGKPRTVTQPQYAACVCLLMQLEMVVTGVVSAIADVPVCKSLSNLITGAMHQQQELGFEITVLFLVRRRLQEVHDEEARMRNERSGSINALKYGPLPDAPTATASGDEKSIPASDSSVIGSATVTGAMIHSSSNVCSNADEETSNASFMSKSEANDCNNANKRTGGNKKKNYVSNVEAELSCVQLLNQLGVGQARAYEDSSDDDDEEEECSSSPDSNSAIDAGSANPEMTGAEVSNGTQTKDIIKGLSTASISANRDAVSKPSHLSVPFTGFAEQLDFVDRMNVVVEALRFIDRAQRSDALQEAVKIWNSDPMKYLGWDPTTMAGEPHYRIFRIIEEECRVFRTKARAPTLIVCEVVRDDLLHDTHYSEHYNLPSKRARRRQLNNTDSASGTTASENHNFNHDKNNASTTNHQKCDGATRDLINDADQQNSPGFNTKETKHSNGESSIINHSSPSSGSPKATMSSHSDNKMNSTTVKVISNSNGEVVGTITTTLQPAEKPSSNPKDTSAEPFYDISADGSIVYIQEKPTPRTKKLKDGSNASRTAAANTAGKDGSQGILTLPPALVAENSSIIVADAKVAPLQNPKNVDPKDVLDSHGVTWNTSPEVNHGESRLRTTSSFKDEFSHNADFSTVSRHLNDVDNILESSMSSVIKDIIHQKQEEGDIDSSTKHDLVAAALLSSSVHEPSRPNTSRGSSNPDSGSPSPATMSRTGSHQELDDHHTDSSGNAHSPNVLPPNVMRKKTSSYLSTNRLNSNAEEIMRSSTATMQPSTQHSRITAAIRASMSNPDLDGLNTMQISVANSNSILLPKAKSSSSISVGQHREDEPVVAGAFSRKSPHAIMRMSESGRFQLSEADTVDNNTENGTASPSPSDSGISNEKVGGLQRGLSAADLEKYSFDEPEEEAGNESNEDDNGLEEQTLPKSHESQRTESTYSVLSMPVSSSTTEKLEDERPLLSREVSQKVLTSAQRLLKAGKVTPQEYEKLIHSDMQYHSETSRESVILSKIRVEHCFGESWQRKKERYLGDRYDSTPAAFPVVVGVSENGDDNKLLLSGEGISTECVDSATHTAVSDTAPAPVLPAAEIDRNRASSLSGTLPSGPQLISSLNIVDVENIPGISTAKSGSSTEKRYVTTSSSAARADNATKASGNGAIIREYWPAWDLRSFIVKTNDDLRQEVCCLQMMQLFKEIFVHFGLSNLLYLKPYRIVSTGQSTGLVQVLTDAMSLDALKKTRGFTSLNNYFNKTYGAVSAERLLTAKRNFAASLAAYSLLSYVLLIKDRHNGNLLIDADGHIIHIDFGFMLSIAPGGSFSLETAPFKLTEEMVEVLGGLDAPLFGEFAIAFTKGFIALQASAENIIGALQILAVNSPFPCFAGRQGSVVVDKLRARFRTELSVADAAKHCLDMITNSYGHLGTRQYDMFQWYSNGIVP